MSNPDSRFGCSPVGHISGAPWNGQTMRCYIPVGNPSALFIGDPVVLAGSADANGTAPTVVKATAGDGNPVAGFIVSFEPVAPGDMGNLNLQITYCPASTAMYCNVCVDPTVLYEVQGDSVAVIAATDVGSNFNLIFTHSGDTMTGQSGVELDSSSKGTTGTYQMKLWAVSSNPSNDISSVNAKWLVLINLNQLFSPGVASTGTSVAGPVGV